MEEEIILNVAGVLEAWNPLGEAANTVEDLSGYRYEAIDIISTIGLMSGPSKVEKSIEQVLSQAFDLELDRKALANAAKEIAHVLGLSNQERI